MANWSTFCQSLHLLVFICFCFFIPRSTEYMEKQNKGNAPLQSCNTVLLYCKTIIHMMQLLHFIPNRKMSDVSQNRDIYLTNYSFIIKSYIIDKNLPEFFVLNLFSASSVERINISFGGHHFVCTQQRLKKRPNIHFLSKNTHSLFFKTGSLYLIFWPNYRNN